MTRKLKDILKVVRVLYIDNEKDVPQSVKNTLKILFKDIYYTDSLDYAMKIYNEKHPDMIISEIITEKNKKVLPFLHQIREYNYLIPIILTASDKKEKTLFDAIRVQPIDFLVKPLTTNSFIYSLNKASKLIMHHGNIVVSLNKEHKYNYLDKTVTKGNKPFQLTKNESRFLEFLIASEGKILSKEEIEFYIWGEEYVSDSAFKSLLKRMRDKIGNNIIKNTPGIGYSLKS